MEVIDWVVLAIILINTLLGISLWPQSNSGLRIITSYFIVQSILEVWSDIVGMQHGNNQFLYHFFVPVLFLILSYLFSVHLSNRRISNFLFITSMLLLVLCWVFSFTVQPLEEINSYAHLVTRLILCGWVVLYLWQLLYVNDYEPLSPNYMFWVSVAVLIHIVNYCFYGVVNIILKYDRELASAWYSKILVIDIVFYCTLAIPSYRLWYQTSWHQHAK